MGPQIRIMGPRSPARGQLIRIKAGQAERGKGSAPRPGGSAPRPGPGKRSGPPFLALMGCRPPQAGPPASRLRRSIQAARCSARHSRGGLRPPAPAARLDTWSPLRLWPGLAARPWSSCPAPAVEIPCGTCGRGAASAAWSQVRAGPSPRGWVQAACLPPGSPRKQCARRLANCAARRVAARPGTAARSNVVRARVIVIGPPRWAGAAPRVAHKGAPGPLRPRCARGACGPPVRPGGRPGSPGDHDEERRKCHVRARVDRCS